MSALALIGGPPELRLHDSMGGKLFIRPTDRDGKVPSSRQASPGIATVRGNTVKAKLWLISVSYFPGPKQPRPSIFNLVIQLDADLEEILI